MSLIGEERKKIILEKINTQGKVYVTALAEELQVSTETIRRYLDELEKRSKLTKVYGGAVKISLDTKELSIELRQVSNLAAKEKIAFEASKLVDDNDIIILDEGSTAFKMVEFIAYKKNLTIVTPSLPTLSILVELQNKGIFDGKIIFIGGVVNSRQGRTAGSLSEEFISSIYAGKAFISTEGISADWGVTDIDIDKTLLSRKFIQNSKLNYVLSDNSKVDVRSVYKICNISDLTGIISDKMPPKKLALMMERYNVLWISPSEEG